MPMTRDIKPDNPLKNNNVPCTISMVSPSRSSPEIIDSNENEIEANGAIRSTASLPVSNVLCVLSVAICSPLGICAIL